MWGNEYDERKRQERRKTISSLVLLALLVGIAVWLYADWFELSWDERELFSAARDGDAAGIFSAIENGADPTAHNRDGLTALHIAAWHGHERAARALISAGADPNARDAETGETPLHSAVRANEPDMAVMLISAGARNSYRTFTESRPDVDGNRHRPNISAYGMARDAGFDEIVRIFGGDSDDA